MESAPSLPTSPALASATHRRSRTTATEDFRKPSTRVDYVLDEMTRPDLTDILRKFLRGKRVRPSRRRKA